MSSSASIASRPTFGETYANGEFKTVVFRVNDDETFMKAHLGVLKSRESRGYAEFSFPNAERLLNVMTSKRWDILTIMAGAGEISIREVARRVNRDVKAVHGDVTELMRRHIIDRGPAGGVIFPYDNLHLDLSYTAAA